MLMILLQKRNLTIYTVAVNPSLIGMLIFNNKYLHLDAITLCITKPNIIAIEV